MTGIIFTDRYGGNPPSWLRGCHGECEAMGFYPEPCDAYTPTGDGCHVKPHNPPRPCPKPNEHAQADFDGWHFLRCPDCQGTGRVPWYVSIARLPCWLAKGARFFDLMARPRYRATHMTTVEHLWLVFKCAFVYDLVRAFR